MKNTILFRNNISYTLNNLLIFKNILLMKEKFQVKNTLKFL